MFFLCSRFRAAQSAAVAAVAAQLAQFAAPGCALLIQCCAIVASRQFKFASRMAKPPRPRQQAEDCLPGMEAFRFSNPGPGPEEGMVCTRVAYSNNIAGPSKACAGIHAASLLKSSACRSEATRRIASESRVRYVAAPWLQEQF